MVWGLSPLPYLPAVIVEHLERYDLADRGMAGTHKAPERSSRARTLVRIRNRTAFDLVRTTRPARPVVRRVVYPFKGIDHIGLAFGVRSCDRLLCGPDVPRKSDPISASLTTMSRSRSNQPGKVRRAREVMDAAIGVVAQRDQQQAEKYVPMSKSAEPVEGCRRLGKAGPRRFGRGQGEGGRGSRVITSGSRLLKSAR